MRGLARPTAGPKPSADIASAPLSASVAFGVGGAAGGAHVAYVSGGDDEDAVENTARRLDTVTHPLRTLKKTYLE